MISNPIPAAEPPDVLDAHTGRRTFPLAVGNAQFEFVPLTFKTQKVSAAAILAALHKGPVDHVVLSHLASGETEALRPNGTIDLTGEGSKRVFVLPGDHLNRFFVGDLSLQWPIDRISVEHIKRLVGAGDHEALVLITGDESIELDDTDFVNLSDPAVERFKLRNRVWRLNVHGVELVLSQPTIRAGEAMEMAGFNVHQDWRIYLKIAGSPAILVNRDYVIDLRTPGIEKLRLALNDVNNGEAPPKPVRDFRLLDEDHAYLDRLGLRWETVNDAGRRWLVLHNFPVMTGYDRDRVSLALEIPPTYPGAAIYGFFTSPPLRPVHGRGVPNPRPPCEICGITYDGWSRYRAGEQWTIGVDNVVTQLSLVELSLAKEVGA